MNVSDADEVGKAFVEYLTCLEERVSELKSLFFFRIDTADSQLRERVTNHLQETNETLKGAEKLVKNLQVYVERELESQEESKKLCEAIEHFVKQVKCHVDQIPAKPSEDSSLLFKENDLSYSNTSKEPQFTQKKQNSRKRHSSNSTSSEVGSITVGHISGDELNLVPQYLRGRLTTEKVNQVIDKLDTLYREKYALLSKPLRGLSSAEIDKVTEYRNQEIDQVLNSYFLSDHDLKTCPLLKFDATTKNTLNVLRHLGRLKEVQSKGKRLYMITN
eukprot:jgi/Galph1/2537/GphlegSOOS_G1188.1